MAQAMAQAMAQTMASVVIDLCHRKTYRNRKRYEESLANLNKSLEINPNNVNVLENHRETYRIMLNRCEESLSDLNKSLKIILNNIEALAYCKSTYLMMNRFEEYL
ncbi:hypothetical protein C2G38_2224527 [Gigaspora rosea]|uniref:Uncharacterized protein n=1 Tax=Gigaspora rosea TaxID=44941 RepID=A0A397U3M9_9GLOM|nr:hypothetical protein C2G38_2224527 [Gigaspora rosea]